MPGRRLWGLLAGWLRWVEGGAGNGTRQKADKAKHMIWHVSCMEPREHI